MCVIRSSWLTSYLYSTRNTILDKALNQGHVCIKNRKKMPLTSPTPMKARTTSKKGKPSFAAIGVSIVATDHQTTPNPKTNLPPTVSAHIPPAI